MEGVEYRKFEPKKDIGRVARLHKEAVSGYNSEGLIERQIRNFAKGKIKGIVAELDSKIIGFGMYEQVGFFNKGIRELMNSKYKENVYKVMLRLKHRFSLEEEIIIDYSNKFAYDKIKRKNVVLTALVVDPQYRRKGIGFEIVRKRIEIAEEIKGAEHIFASCIEGSGSFKIYKKLDFERLCYVRPGYKRGSGMIFVGKRTNL